MKNVEILNDRINYLEKDRKNSEEQLNKFEQKVNQLYQDKENLLNEKSKILEEKNEILQQVTDKELELQQKDQTIADLRAKFKQSSGDLLSKTMEIDKLVKRLKAMDGLEQQESSKSEEVKTLKAEIEKLKEELAKAEQAVGKGEIKETMVIHNFETILEQIKTILPEGRSTIRLVFRDIMNIG